MVHLRLLALSAALPSVFGASAVATFGGAGPTGSIEFVQDGNGTSPTHVHVDLKGLEGNQTSWFLNALPVMSDCSMASLGRSYNPMGVAAAVPCTKGAGPCKVGDLLGKHGWLHGASVNTSYTDEEITLTGPGSVLYRSVLLASENGTRYACATIMPKGQANVTVLKAEFPKEGVVVGDIYFVQKADDPTALTTVMVEVALASGAALNNATYHVHEKPLANATESCNATGKHFNPAHGPACKPTNVSGWATCEVGDISGRHGHINLPAMKDGRVFLHDSYLPLSGNLTINGRSVVVHDETGKRIACTNIVSAPSLPFKSHWPLTVGAAAVEAGTGAQQELITLPGGNRRLRRL